MLAFLLQAWLLAGPAAQTSNHGLSLAWDAPAGCPNIEQLRARIAEFAPGVLDDPTIAGVRVDGRIEAFPGRFEATIRVENQDGASVRRFGAADCELVADASALVIAVALAPVESASTMRERPPTQTPAEPVEPAAQPDESQAPEPEEQPAEQSQEQGSPPALVISLGPEQGERAESPLVRVGLRAFGGAAYGPTDTGYGVLGGGLALFSNRWRVELAGSWSPPRVVRRGDLGGTFEGWTIAARGCFVPSWRRLEFPLCPGLEFGRVHGRGLDELPVVREASFPWIALGLAQGLWFVPHERLALGVDAQLVVPLRGGAFVVEDRQVQRLVPVGIRALVGVEVRLP